MKRRDLFRSALATGTTAILCAQASAGSATSIVDTNVNLFQWPFRRLPLDQTPDLIAKLQSLGVTSAMAGSYEGLFHRDIKGVNQRLASVCVQDPFWIPVGAVNLALPGWERDLQDCMEKHRMSAVRLHPNYHQYDLRDARFAQLLRITGEAGVLVQLAVAMEDVRTQHPLVQVPDVDLEPLPEVLADFPEAVVQLLNLRPRTAQLESLSDQPNIHFDTSRMDGTDGIAQVLELIPANRVHFGSHAPFLIPEAALIRIHESNLEPEALQAILQGSPHFQAHP